MRHWIFGLSGLVAAALALPATANAENFSLWTRSDSSTFMPKLVDAFNASQKEHHADLQIVPVNELVPEIRRCRPRAAPRRMPSPST